MKVNIEVDLKPFRVPNFVLINQKPRPKEEGFNPENESKYHLSDLDSITLDRLCAEFRTEVFKKAGREMPPTAG